MEQEAAARGQWWPRLRWKPSSRDEGLAAERALLALSTTKLDVVDVPVGPGREDFMHTLRGGAANAESPMLVYLPGYGAGAGFMFRTFAGLTAGFRLFAVDLLGTGMSGRPPFRARSTAQAEDFFVDSLERWRLAQGGERIVLVGHSLGGYLAAVYALRHPDSVRHLVLVCPAGVGRKPADWQPPDSLRSPWTVRGQLFRTAARVWDWGVTPGSIVRGIGPWGPGLVSGYARRRFKQGLHLTEDETLAFGRYMYHVMAGRGSGEYALRHLLEPFAFPRAPLEDRLHALKVPLTFIYGEHDWMDPKAAQRVCDALAGAAGRPLAPADLRIITTPNSGHYPQIDQPGTFLEQLVQAVEGQLPEPAARRVLAAAVGQPFSAAPSGDDAAELREEMRSNPAAAEVHVATDL